MNLKKIREQSGLTQSELAARSGVNLRSLQDYEQGHKSICSARGETLLKLSLSLGCRIEDILIENMNDTDLMNNRSKMMKNRISVYEKRILDRKEAIVHFPVIEADEFVDMSRIYPTKQGSVKSVMNKLRNDSRISSLRLFGSSITMACNRDSDLDFAVVVNDTSTKTLNDISEKIQMACAWGADIIWMNRLSSDERLYKEIMKGLVLI